MEPDDGLEDEGPYSSWLSPDDRLWRHPSEIQPPGARSAPYSDAPYSDAPYSDAPHLEGRTGVGALGRPGRTWAVAVVAGVVGALLVSGVTMATGDFGRKTTVLQAVTRVAAPDTVAVASRSATTPSRSLGMPDWPSVANAIQATVVAVSTTEGSTGSGVVYATGSSHSYIITSDQLVTGGIDVTFNNGERRSARLLRSDAKSGLAVLVVPGGLRPVPIFSSVSGLQVAEPLLAVGAVAAAGPASVPLSVQSVDDAVAASDDQTMVGLLAVTGSSPTVQGGALLDARGDVVGITTSMTALDPAQQNTAYAIPIDVARHVASQLLTGEPVTHPYLGVVDSVDLSKISARQLGVSGGALIETVAPGSPAAGGGLVADDVITEINGQAVGSAGTLVAMLGTFRPDSSIQVSYLHQGKPAAATIRIVEQPSSIIDPDGY